MEKKLRRLSPIEAKSIGLTPKPAYKDGSAAKYLLTDEQFEQVQENRYGGIIESSKRSKIDAGAIKHMWIVVKNEEGKKEGNLFVKNPIELGGRKVKIVDKASFNREFRGYPETFVHLITRESKLKGQRMFDKERTNRLHWIKPILLNTADPRIKYYEYSDEKGVLKQHFWFQERDFMVVLKPIGRDLLVVTGFKVDKLEKQTYLKRYQNYQGL